MATILHFERGGHTTFYEKWDASDSRAFHIVKDLVNCIEADIVKSRAASGNHQEGADAPSPEFIY